MTTFDTLTQEPLENIVGKGENAGNQHFLLFLQCFRSCVRPIGCFEQHLIFRLQNAFNLEKSKILSSGNALRVATTFTYAHNRLF